MSPVLHEAIVLAAALQHEYVWIDSLCIIQDDKKDWEKEAPKMGSVYSHATVVLQHMGVTWALRKSPLLKYWTQQDQVIAQPSPER